MKQRVFEVEVGANWAFDKEAKLDPALDNSIAYSFAMEFSERSKFEQSQVNCLPIFVILLFNCLSSSSGGGKKLKLLSAESKIPLANLASPVASI